MSLDSSEVEKIAHLARLSIHAGDVAEYARDLSSILDLVAQLNAVDAEGVVPMAHPLELSQRLRPDEVLEQNLRERFQSVAPRVESGLYLVPRVIE